MTKDELIEKMQLERHPEGGAFKETYRSGIESEFLGFEGKRSTSTAIYFLIGGDDISAFHRIKSDEMWHFYKGSPITIVEITPKGELIKTQVGNDLNFQYIVKAGHWFASFSSGEYSLVGCTVSPGFDFNDFEMANRQELISKFPEHRDIITKLT